MTPLPLSSSSPLSRDSRPRLRKFDNDDMPQEKVARIYQEELVKLMSRPQEPPLPLPRDPQYPGILFPFLGQSLLFNRSPEEVKLALDAYHQELSKLQGGTGMGLGAAGTSHHHDKCLHFHHSYTFSPAFIILKVHNPT